MRLLKSCRELRRRSAIEPSEVDAKFNASELRRFPWPRRLIDQLGVLQRPIEVRQTPLAGLIEQEAGPRSP
jgi:hypothetical protein